MATWTLPDQLTRKCGDIKLGDGELQMEKTGILRTSRSVCEDVAHTQKIMHD